MNSLEQQKQALLKESRKTNADDAIETGIEKGFNAAIALDLPVKFVEWLRDETIDTNPVNNKWVTMEHGEKSSQDLYQYWIDNVYGKEETA